MNTTTTTTTTSTTATSTATSRRGRRLAGVALVASAAVAGIAAGVSPAMAAPAPHSAATVNVHPDGRFAVQTCTSVNGSVQFQPGLQAQARTQTALLSATLSGCSFNGSVAAGQGTLTAVLTGSASTSAQSLTGTYTINWPAAENLNPSTGKITLTGPNANVVTLSGTGTGGAFNGLPVGTAYFISGQTSAGRSHRSHNSRTVTSQTFVNTVPLQVTENLG